MKLFQILCVGGALVLSLGLTSPLSAAPSDPAYRSLYGRTKYFVDEFEKEVLRAKGGTAHFFNKTEALQRVRDLVQKYPNEPEVQALFKRTSSLLMRSKGDFIEITPEMLAYRDIEKRLKGQFSRFAVEEWKRLLVTTGADSKRDPFPAPDAKTVSLRDLEDRYVVLKGVTWPQTMFAGSSGIYLAYGQPSSGYYYIDASSRNFIGPYEALKRYRRQIDSSLGESFSFTVLGKIKSVVCDFPEAEEQKIGAPQWGWVVVPEALYVEGVALGIYDRSKKNSGRYAGEDKARDVKSAIYTVNAVPPNATPDKVMEIFATAIKEKNFDLYAECIDPELQKTPVAKSLLRYHWDLHQERFKNEYVAVSFGKPTITIVKGFNDKNDLENFFLDSSQQATLAKIEGERVEQAIVESKAWMETGKQRGAPQVHSLKRRNGGRWFVDNYEVRF